MPEPFLITLAIHAFLLIYFGILSLLSARFLLNLQQAKIALGLGPKLLIIDLNRFRYQIRSFPFLFCDVSYEYELKRSQSIVIYLLSAFGLFILCLAFTYASLRMGEKVGPAVDPNLNSDTSITVRSVEPGSPADQAGLKPGMIILEVNGQPVKTGFDLIAQYGVSKESIEIKVLPEANASSPVNVTVNKEAKAKVLGTTYGVVSSGIPVTSTNRFTQIAKILRVSVVELKKVTRAELNLTPTNIRISSTTFPSVNLLVYTATLALLLAFMALLFALFDSSFFLVPLGATYFALGYWKLALVIAILLALFYLVERSRVFLLLVSLIWVFFIFPVYVHLGLYEGMLTWIAQLNRLEVLWPL